GGTAFKDAGPKERAKAMKFLASATMIPDNPSERVMSISWSSQEEFLALGQNDKIIFGTGDQLGITTVTTDSKFVRAAAAKGIDLKVQTFSPASYKGI
ncbi:MAG: DUF1308 domain-containing protein, partial [Kofleriaceae bacterium]